MKFLLWVEPERAQKDAPELVAHPEYFIPSDDEENTNQLLNLGNEDAWNYSFRTLCNLIEEIGIDWETDTYDAGLHLNVWGAEKLSSYFGKILQEQCGVSDRRDDASISADWAEKVQTYYDRYEKLTSEK